MGYSREIYEKALKQKLDLKKEKENTYRAALENLRAVNPEFCEIEISLAKAGSSVALAAISGDMKSFENLKEFCIKQNQKKAEILKAQGIKKPEIECKKCEDSGFFGGKFCDCVTSIAKSLAFSEMSRSIPLADSSFESFDLNFYSDKPQEDVSFPRKRATAILNLCKNFAENFSPDTRSLLFMGGTGLGKTHLSLALVSEISAKGYGVVYGSAQNLFSVAEKEHFSFSGTTEAQDSLLSCDLLVIDDLGTEFYSSFAASLFYNIINSRILNRKPTVINTNLSFDELEKRYSPRITSRFIGHYDMKKFIGDDIRQQKILKDL